MKWTNKSLLRLQKWAGNEPKKETGAIYGWNVLKDTEFENRTRKICRESESKLNQNIRFGHSLKTDDEKKLKRCQKRRKLMENTP